MIIAYLFITIFAVFGVFCLGMILGFYFYHHNETFQLFVDSWADKNLEK